MYVTLIRYSWGNLSNFHIIYIQESGPQGVTDLLHRHDTGGTNPRVRDLVIDGKNRKGPGNLSGQGRAEAHRETAVTQDIRDLVLTITDGRYEGGRDRLNSDLNPLEAEYGRAIYCDAADSGPV